MWPEGRERPRDRKSLFFVTAQRVGEQLALADGAGIALTRDRLEDAIATEGAVHRTATAYRRAVDEALFGLGSDEWSTRRSS